MNEKTSGMLNTLKGCLDWKLAQIHTKATLPPPKGAVRPGPKTQPIGSCFLPEVAA